MTRRWLFLASPLALAAGCLLPAFETVEGGAGGAGGSSMAGSSGSGGASAMAGNGGGGEGAETNGGSGGGAGQPVLADDVYFVVQGEDLSRISSNGLLANDEAGLEVTSVVHEDPSRPAAFDAELEVEPNGAFSFTPAPGFFGLYEASYEATNADGVSGSARVRFYVQPVDVELAAVAQNIGGFCVTGQDGDGTGLAVSAAGDVDGDGVDDLLVGAPHSDSDAGAVYVVLGRPRPTSFELAPLEANADEERFYSFTGSAGSLLGSAVAPAGDVLGDTKGEFLVGAPSGNGSVFVATGSEEYGGTFPLAAFDPVVLTGGASDLAGSVLAGGSDVSGDDVPDPLIVVKLASDLNKGGYYAIDGASLAEGTLASADGQLVKGSESSDNASQAVAHVGDVDGDDANDILIATSEVIALVRGPSSSFPISLSNADFTGANGARVLRSNADLAEPVSISAAGDFDGDGQRDVAYCEDDSGCVVAFSPATSLDTGLIVEGLGESALVAGGYDFAADPDTSAESHPDLLFAQRDTADDADADQIYVLFGGSGEQSGTIDVGSLGGAGFTLTAEEGSSLQSLAPVGDVNDDGFQDFAVGDAGNGRVCVVFGGPYQR